MHKPDHPDKSRTSLVILISGRGSNMLAIAEACQSGELNATVDLVISNRADAAGLSAAEEQGLETAVIEHKKFVDRHTFDAALSEQIQQVAPDWIVLAGFMRILTPEFVNQWQGRILNIHPSLLPLYPGLDTHRQAIAAGDTHSGASVHIVTPQLDAGPVIAQKKIPILPDDTPDDLAKRVLEQEHDLYINALKTVCQS